MPVLTHTAQRSVRRPRKAMQKLTILLLLLITAACASHQNSERKSKLRTIVVSQGVYELLGEKTSTPLSASPSGRIGSTTKGVRLVEETDSIPVDQNLNFGFEVFILGLPEDTEFAELRYEVTHPRMRLPNGEERNSFSYPIIGKVRGGVLYLWATYQMSNGYDRLAGHWSLAYYAGDTLLAKAKFHVSPIHRLRTRERRLITR